ncbi:MAG: sialidase family protein [Pseudomonadota bacterium]
MERDFIFVEAPFASAHASTIAETGDALIAAWFGGVYEGHTEVGIWISRRDAEVWSKPIEVAKGRDARGNPLPCWNPVLFQPRVGPLLLFYKVGPSPRRWWGMVMRSSDQGQSWSAPERLPRGILGPIKNKPIELPDGTWLSPSSTEWMGWRCHLERSADQGATWDKRSLTASRTGGSIQPAILRYPDGSLQIVCRSKQRSVTTCRSRDGAHWDGMQALDLPQPNSGLDAVMLADGRALLVYNHSRDDRTPLNLALSQDGRQWQPSRVLEDGPGEFSYPAIIQGRHGRIHITYTWDRERIRYVNLAPSDL